MLMRKHEKVCIMQASIGVTTRLSNITVYAQANHLAQLRALLEDAKISLNKMIRDRGYVYNSYIRGE